jgi:hypothetical protein
VLIWGEVGLVWFKDGVRWGWFVFIWGEAGLVWCGDGMRWGWFGVEMR